MSRSLVRNWLIVLGTLCVVSLLAGVAGVLMACYPSALLPINFFEYGHCFATDTPKEVFGSFAMIGLIFIGPVLAIFVVTWTMKKRDHSK